MVHNNNLAANMFIISFILDWAYILQSDLILNEILVGDDIIPIAQSTDYLLSWIMLFLRVLLI